MMPIDIEYPGSFNVLDNADSLLKLTACATKALSTEYLKRKVDYTPIEKLSDLLYDAAIKMADTEKKWEVDYNSVLVLWETLRKYKHNRHIEDPNELALKVALVSQELRTVRALPNERIRAVRNFCRILSIEINKHSESKFKLITV